MTKVIDTGKTIDIGKTGVPNALDAGGFRSLIHRWLADAITVRELTERLLSSRLRLSRAGPSLLALARLSPATLLGAGSHPRWRQKSRGGGSPHGTLLAQSTCLA